MARRPRLREADAGDGDRHIDATTPNARCQIGRVLWWTRYLWHNGFHIVTARGVSKVAGAC